MKHPMQPIEKDENGIPRFKENKIVSYLLESGVYDLNTLAIMPFNQEDREQFAQLIGYSVGGFGELSYVNPESVAEADEKAELLISNAAVKPRRHGD